MMMAWLEHASVQPLTNGCSPLSRSSRSGLTDAALIDEALKALLDRDRAAEIDASYTAYDQHPIDEPDEWGDLATWSRAAADS